MIKVFNLLYQFHKKKSCLANGERKKFTTKRQRFGTRDRGVFKRVVKREILPYGRRYKLRKSGDRAKIKGDFRLKRDQKKTLVLSEKVKENVNN